MTMTRDMQEVLDDLSTSDCMKNAIYAFLERDPTVAADETGLLASLFRQRADRLSLNEPVVWNTRALYTKHGQRMAAQLVDDNTIVFIDIDRCINGYFRIEHPEFLLDSSSLKARVNHAYLHNKYENFAHLKYTDLIEKLRDAALTAPSLWKED